MMVYPNDRMDGLIPVGISVLSSHLKHAGHEVKLYDTTFYDTGKATGDSFREQMGQVIPVDLSKYGVSRTKINLNDSLKINNQKYSKVATNTNCLGIWFVSRRNGNKSIGHGFLCILHVNVNGGEIISKS